MRYLALDVGERRTGVAVGEWIARPLTTLVRRSKAEDFAAIARLVREHQADAIVVGLPLDMNGSMGPQAQRVMQYAGQLEEALANAGLDTGLVFWDERLSTDEASQVVAAGGRRSRALGVDAVAAAVILQSYLDEQARAGSEQLSKTETE